MAQLCYFPEINDRIEFKGWNYQTSTNDINIYMISDINSTHIKFNNRFMSIINFVKEYKWDNIKECWIKNAF